MSSRGSWCTSFRLVVHSPFTAIAGLLRILWCRRRAPVRSGVGEGQELGPVVTAVAPARAVRPQLTFVELSPEFGYRLLTAKTVGELRDLFPSFLNHYLYATDLASSDSEWTAAARAVRALRAGFSARRVLQGHFHLVAKSLSIPWNNQFYIVLRTNRHPSGWCTSSCELYTAQLCVGTDLEEGSISHGFPSLSEVEIYLRGAHRQWPCELNHLP